jgi:Flp pilus assembly protein TadG
MQYNRSRGSNIDDVQHLPRFIVILMIAVVLIIVAGGAGLVYVSISSQAATHAQATATAQANTVATAAAATATTHAHATATAIANATATTIASAHTTATAIANATVTAVANAQATAMTIAVNPDPYPPAGGRLALFDPLSNNSHGYNWSANPTNCVFTGGAYHVIAPDPRFFASCLAQSTNFTNFAYEVQMKIIKGDLGGIIFRGSTNNNFYLFYVTQLGSYELLLCPGNTCRQIVATTSSPAINRGLNSTNIVAVVVTGTTITLYVNHQKVTSVNDSTYSHGQIGVAASPFANAGHPTEVVYSNARVWTL